MMERACLGQCQIKNNIMKALILDGSRPGDNALRIANTILSEELKSRGWEIVYFLLRDTNIAPCLGCFDCWLKTPGVCVTNDAGRDTARAAATSDLWILLTPITFGGYSSNLKKAIDRLLPLLVPVFTQIQGETHHKFRYKKYANLVAVGMTTSSSIEQENVFRKLVSRNAINFYNPIHFIGFVSDDNKKENIVTMLSSLLNKIIN